LLGSDEAQARTWQITLEITRAGTIAYSGQTTVSQIKRPFNQLIDFLMRCQAFPHGVVLLTGTGVVPPNEFTLHPGDVVRIRIDAIGVLENPVVQV
jgi:2-dehydro-3-deoxy-D-arabinonate dehydratase